jgi:hypothetical protein
VLGLSDFLPYYSPLGPSCHYVLISIGKESLVLNRFLNWHFCARVWEAGSSHSAPFTLSSPTGGWQGLRDCPSISFPSSKLHPLNWIIPHHSEPLECMAF